MSIKTNSTVLPALEFHPLTPDRWDDLKTLFGERGATGGCWCMWWRLKRSEYDQQKGEGNKQAFKRIVESGAKPGILAYADGQPVAWCAVEPRQAYPVLGRSRNLKRVDDQPVWSIVCLFVNKAFRGQGITVQLIQAAVEYAKAQGAKIIEGYPVDPKTPNMPTVFAWTGFVSAYRQVGFEEVLRRSETRPIMRYNVAT
jgi:GNAT superfamily N-acetyltransferase